MSIIRGPRPDSKFYTVDKAISEDTRLSWAARGLLIFLLGKPDHWRVSVKHLIQQTEGAVGKSSGRDAVRVILQELQQVGYVQARQARGADGEFSGIEYVVNEVPVPPQPKSPEPENPSPGNPSPENPHLVNKEEKVKKEEEAKNQPPSHAGDAKRAAAAKSQAGHTPLPDDFADNETHRAYAAEHGMDIEHELGMFKDKAQAEGWTAMDWAAKFRTFLRKSVEFRAKRAAGGQAPRRQGPAPRNAGLVGGQGAPVDYTEGINDDGSF